MPRELYKIGDPAELTLPELKRVVTEVNEILLNISRGLLTDGGTTEVTHAEVVTVLSDVSTAQSDITTLEDASHTQDTDTKLDEGGSDEVTAADLKTIVDAILSDITLICRIKTGTYTGDGSTSQAITGVGFQPKLLLIFTHPTGDAQNANIYWKLDQSWSTYCLVEWGGAAAGSGPAGYDNRVLSLDSDGFTVDDAGSDLHPNANGTTYDYAAIG